MNCQRNYPWYRAWQKDFEGKGVVQIGIHTPETKGEADLKKIREKAKENGLTYAIAVDNDQANWKAWGNRWWPSTYLIDKKGYCRARWDGELDWKDSKGQEAVKKAIEGLLKE